MRDVLVAELDTPERAVATARRVRELGYARVEAYTPFQVPELDEVLAIHRTRLPLLVFGAGLSGGAVALVVQWWTNAYDYPWLISGKPYWSIPANVPIMFELTVLFSGITALVATPRSS